MGSRRQLERRLESAEGRTVAARQENVIEGFKRLTVRDVAHICSLEQRGGEYVPACADQKEAARKLKKLLDEAEEVFTRAEILRLVTDTARNMKSNLSHELRRMNP